jgi:hypothetical protein
MPVFFRYKGYQFFFFSNEGNPREPLHVHVRHGDARAKFWISPVALASNYGFSASALNELANIVADNAALIERTWHDYFGD